MKAHADLKNLLKGKKIQAFVKDMCLHAYSWTEKIPTQYLEYKIFEEFRLRQDTGEKTRIGLDKKLQVIPDVILFIKPGYRALNQGHCFTIALEIKEFKEDLMRDEKLWKYVGWTDFFFIAVPDDLTQYTFEKIVEVNNEHPETLSKIGVLGLETGELYSHPQRSEVSIEKQNLVLQNAVYNYAFKDAKTIFFTPEELPAQVALTGKNMVDEDAKNSAQNNLQQNCKLKNSDTQQYEEQQNNLQENCTLKNRDTLQYEERQNNLQESCTLRKGGYKQLSNEEKAARKAAFLARQEFREKRAVELAEKSTVLNEDIRQRLMAQPPKAQEVFWKIRESKNGKQLQDIVSELDYSQRTAAYGLASLTSAGLIKRDGSRKTGAYTVTDVAACNTTCATCSIALQCKDYKPV